jgi:hypothetical protein
MPIPIEQEQGKGEERDAARNERLNDRSSEQPHLFRLACRAH